MILDDDTAYEFAKSPPELRSVLAVIGHEGGKCLLLLSELAERAKVPTAMARSALWVAVEKGIVRVRGQGRKRPRPYAIEIISKGLRPTRSASHPLAVAPTNRPHKVRVNTAVTSTNGTLKVLAIGAMTSRKIVKSKASSVQPSHAATHAYH